MIETKQDQPRPKWRSAQHTLLTAEELLKMPDDDYRYELVKGVLRKMPPAGFEHGIRTIKIGSRLNVYVENNRLGCVCGAETGFVISRNPDTVRAPDAAFIRQSVLDQRSTPKGYWEGAPDLAVEVISPGDTYTEVSEKVADWLQAGCAMVWVINPRRETIEVHRSVEDFTTLSGDDTLDGGDVVEGFQCRVRDIFG